MLLSKKTKEALKWITEILHKNNIPYKIGGGFAASVYGSSRKINDIDISVSGKYFSIIVPEVSKYITAGPKHYLNEKWDCNTLSLEYNNQEIDLTDIDTLRMSNLEKTEWFDAKNRRLFDGVMMEVDGIMVSIMDPRDLISYKKELGGEHQLIDIKAIQEYINKNITNN